jgi:hypothetical protein
MKNVFRNLVFTLIVTIAISRAEQAPPASSADSSELDLLHEHQEFDTYEDFLNEFYHKDTKNPEVQYIQQTFTNIDVHLSAHDYSVFLEKYLERHINHEDADKETSKEHRDHHEVLARAYLEQRDQEAEKSAFDLRDAYLDIIDGDFLFYVDTVEVKTPGELAEEDQLSKEVEEELKEAENEEEGDGDDTGDDFVEETLDL